MRSASDALREATNVLASMTDTPRLEAELLLAHALGCSREELLLRMPEVPDGFDRLLARRLAHEPLAYIVGHRAFWTIELEVAPGVLIPRPDSETLLEAAVAHFGERAPERVLDLGTGSGALLLAALNHWPEATGLGVDASAAALAVAGRNAARVAPGRSVLRCSDWADGLTEQFDLVLCNPPYVEADAPLAQQVRAWEPAEALFAGAHGLDDYRRLSGQIAPLIAPGGIACIELGAEQFEAVAELFKRDGYRLDGRRDLGGHVRCLTITHE